MQAHLVKFWSPWGTHNKNDCYRALMKRKERRKLMLVPLTDSIREFAALRADKEASKASKTFHRHSLHQKKNKRWTWKYSTDSTVWVGGFAAVFECFRWGRWKEQGEKKLDQKQMKWWVKVTTRLYSYGGTVYLRQMDFTTATYCNYTSETKHRKLEQEFQNIEDAEGQFRNA